MTIVAFDGTTLAADRLLSFEDGTFCEVTKIFTRNDGVIYGVAGSGPQVGAVRDWFEEGGNPAGYPSIDGDPDKNHVELLYIDDGDICLLLNGPHPICIESKQFAIGCASEAALVLMDVGFSAELAVQKVSEKNLYCGCGVDVLRAR